MPLAASLQRKVDRLLTKYAPPFCTVYKRIVTRAGGDALIGQAVVVTNTDTLLVPQPTYARAMRRQVGGSDAEEVSTPVGARVANSYEMTVSLLALTEADLQNQDILFLFVDPSGVQEIYRLDDFEPMGVSGQPVAWLVYVTSVSR